MDGQIKPLKNEKPFLLTLAGMQFTHVLDFMIMVPLGPQLIRLMGINTYDFGLLLSCYTFGAAFSSLLAANFIDRFDQRKTFLLIYALFTLATLACALAQSFTMLLLARILAGAFGGMVEAMVNIMVAATIPYARRGAAMGTIYGAFSLSTVIGVPLGLFLANFFPQLSWHAPFFFLSLICALFFVLAYLYLPHLPRQVPSGKTLNLFAVFAVKQLRLPLLFVALATCGGFLVTPYLPLYLTSNVGVEEISIPSIYLCAGVVTLFSSRLIGKMADRYGKQQVFRFLAVASCLPLLVSTHLTPVAFWLVLLNAICLFVLVPGRMIAGMAFLSSLPAAHMRASFMNLVAAVQMSCIGLSALASGLIMARDSQGHILHFAWSGYLAVFCGLIAAYLVMRLQPAPNAQSA